MNLYAFWAVTFRFARACTDRARAPRFAPERHQSHEAKKRMIHCTNASNLAILSRPNASNSISRPVEGSKIESLWPSRIRT